MDDKCHDNLAGKLRTTGLHVKGNPEGRSFELRNCIKNLDRFSIEIGDRRLLFIAYLLNFFIEDVWSNIALDSSYRNEIRDEDSIRILSQIGDGFCKLADHLEQKDYYSSYEVCVDLVCDYLETIDEINERLRAGI